MSKNLFHDGSWRHARVCSECSFELWESVAYRPLVTVGLYDDARFEGRLIVSLNHHFDHFDEVPASLAGLYMAAVQDSMRVVKKVTGVERVNMAILGNAVSHVHAHLIPRRPEDDQPEKAPWEDRRNKEVLAADVKEELLKAYRSEFERS